MKAWEELEAKIAALPQFESNVVAFRRCYLSAAVECDLDKQGRDILIPPSPPRARDLTKDVLWAGMSQTTELWSKERRKAAQQIQASSSQSFNGTAIDSCLPMNVENIVLMHLPSLRRRARASRAATSAPGRDEVVDALSLAQAASGLYVDATLGAGGHTEAILRGAWRPGHRPRSATSGAFASPGQQPTPRAVR